MIAIAHDRFMLVVLTVLKSSAGTKACMRTCSIAPKLGVVNRTPYHGFQLESLNLGKHCLVRHVERSNSVLLLVSKWHSSCLRVFKLGRN